MSSSPDADLAARCQRGDARAWDELFDTHYAATGRFIFQLSSDLTIEDAQEICQETFLAVIGNIGSFRGDSRLQTWIFRIASNKTRDYREHSKAAKRGGGQTPVPLHPVGDQFELPFDLPSPAPTPDRALMRVERAAQLSQGLDQLEPACRDVIELRYFGDLSYEEIAADLKLNPKTVSSRLSKCLDRLGVVMDNIIVGSDSSRFSV
jgi:RNA polymerase sigma-70 factor (ECF subfamily)